MNPLRAIYNFVAPPIIETGVFFQHAAHAVAHTVHAVVLKIIGVASKLVGEAGSLSTIVGLGKNSIKLMHHKGVEHPSLKPLLENLDTVDAFLSAKDAVHAVEGLLNPPNNLPRGLSRNCKIISTALYLGCNIIDSIRWASSMALTSAAWLKRKLTITISTPSTEPNKELKASTTLTAGTAQMALVIAASVSSIFSNIAKLARQGFGGIREGARSILSLITDITRIGAMAFNTAGLKTPGLILACCSKSSSLLSAVIRAV